jgi:hypothetical protein
MHPRRYRHERVARLGQVRSGRRRRTVAILSVPALSLLLPAAAVAVASAGGRSQFTRTAADVARFLLFYSGVFALIALTAAVAAGLLATDRTVMSPERRILAQALHRTASLIGISALANHIMLEILASRAGVADGFVPFMAARNTFYMGLGTLASDLFVVIIVTGALRRRFSTGARRWLWRSLHVTAYAAWPMAILHGLLAGRAAKPYVDWSYGACLAAVALGLTVRSVAAVRGRNAADPVRSARPRATASGGPGLGLGQPRQVPEQLTAGQVAAAGPAWYPPPRPMRALPAGAAWREPAPPQPAPPQPAPPQPAPPQPAPPQPAPPGFGLPYYDDAAATDPRAWYGDGAW